LKIELAASQLTFESQKALKVIYKNQCVGDFVADIIVDKALIIELKSVQSLLPIHEVQLVNYLTATGIEEGMTIINNGFASGQTVIQNVNSTTLIISSVPNTTPNELIPLIFTRNIAGSFILYLENILPYCANQSF
jgi:GxxExxY protein